MIGLKRGIVKLLPYDADWEREFEEEKGRLKETLGNLVVKVEHVGSTSIPGMMAKPIIDIGVGVSFLTEGTKKELIKLLESLGYEYMANRGSKDRLFFAKGSDERRTHYLHLTELGSREWWKMIAFRDYLRKHKDWAEKYADLKKRLAGEFGKDRETYLQAKSKFIEEVLERAGKMMK